jgi:hypothetical protein
MAARHASVAELVQAPSLRTLLGQKVCLVKLSLSLAAMRDSADVIRHSLPHSTTLPSRTVPPAACTCITAAVTSYPGSPEASRVGEGHAVQRLNLAAPAPVLSHLLTAVAVRHAANKHLGGE